MSGLSPEAQSKLDELKQEYILSLPEKMEALNKYWDMNNLEGLSLKCHKIAGSAASFDLPDISFAAKTLEALCKTRLDHNRAAKSDIREDKTLVDGFTVLLESLSKNTK